MRFRASVMGLLLCVTLAGAEASAQAPPPSAKARQAAHTLPTRLSEGGGHPYGPAFAIARAERESVRAQMEAISLKRMSGELLSAAEVSADWMTAFRGCRDQLLAIPTVVPVPGTTPMEQHACREGIRKVIERTLEDLAEAFEQLARAADVAHS